MESKILNSTDIVEFLTENKRMLTITLHEIVEKTVSNFMKKKFI